MTDRVSPARFVAELAAQIVLPIPVFAYSLLVGGQLPLSPVNQTPKVFSIGHNIKVSSLL